MPEHVLELLYQHGELLGTRGTLEHRARRSLLAARVGTDEGRAVPPHPPPGSTDQLRGIRGRAALAASHLADRQAPGRSRGSPGGLWGAFVTGQIRHRGGTAEHFTRRHHGPDISSRREVRDALPPPWRHWPDGCCESVRCARAGSRPPLAAQELSEVDLGREEITVRLEPWS